MQRKYLAYLNTSASQVHLIMLESCSIELAQGTAATR